MKPRQMRKSLLLDFVLFICFTLAGCASMPFFIDELAGGSYLYSSSNTKPKTSTEIKSIEQQETPGQKIGLQMELEYKNLDKNDIPSIQAYIDKYYTNIINNSLASYNKKDTIEYEYSKLVDKLLLQKLNTVKSLSDMEQYFNETDKYYENKLISERTVNQEYKPYSEWKKLTHNDNIKEINSFLDRSFDLPYSTTYGIVFNLIKKYKIDLENKLYAESSGSISKLKLFLPQCDDYALAVKTLDEIFQLESKGNYHGYYEIGTTSKNMENPYSFKKNEYYYMNNFSIIQWISDTEALASRTVGDQRVFYIKYNDPPVKNISNALLKYKGTFKYENTLGANQIVPSFDLIDIVN